MSDSPQETLALSTPLLELCPIGFVRAQATQKFQLPSQPGLGQAHATIELIKGHNYEVALRDLDGFERIWLLWWFHKNRGWRPTTLPPRGRGGRKGTFATRSPYRPNPLGLSCVRLLDVKDRSLWIGEHDLLDGTPVLDLKPYIPQFDSFQDSTCGWFGAMQQSLHQDPGYQVLFESSVGSLAPELKNRIVELLSSDPFPHRTRRIVTFADGYRLSCGDYRIFFQIKKRDVTVSAVRHRHELLTPEQG